MQDVWRLFANARPRMSLTDAPQRPSGVHGDTHFSRGYKQSICGADRAPATRPAHYTLAAIFYFFQNLNPPPFFFFAPPSPPPALPSAEAMEEAGSGTGIPASAATTSLTNCCTGSGPYLLTRNCTKASSCPSFFASIPSAHSVFGGS
eukprot:TRINITY_DN3018_c0_g1_i7.p2 TRINITY_DN3018_c0_g1~~TRINITY_DN3018_c0_g1_i7.p2  ORF type:complete len:148 (-),score=4.61 TRINITY_DN3018_c0_g1_i7:16-459(-)